MTQHEKKAGVAVSTATPAFDFAIEEGKAHEFARATGASGLTRADSGWLAPPTFLTVSQLWMAPEHSAWHGITRNYGRVLHGEQRFEYPRGLPRVGSRFRARQSFGRSFEKHGSQGLMHFQEVVTRFWQPDGPGSETDPDAIMTSLSITLPPLDPQEATDEKTTPSKQAAAAVSEPEQGLDRYTAPPLTLTDFVRYQGASGDFNPIHHDPEFARAGGFDGPFAVGMLAAGVAATRFNLVRDPNRLQGLRMRWQSPAWPGDELTYLVTDAEDGLECKVTNQHGESHMTAWGTYA